MERAIIYCRTNSNGTTGIEIQEKACRRFAEENNYAVEKVFTDNDVSGADIKTCRQLHSLIGYLTVTDKRPYYLIVASVDRLGRNYADVARLIQHLSNLDVQVVSADKDQRRADSAFEQLKLNIIEAFKHFESELEANELSRG